MKNKISYKERKNMKEIIKKHFRSVISMVLIAAMVLTFAGCGQKQAQESPETTQNHQEVVEKSFVFEVTDLDGTKTEFSVKYDTETTVGEALIKENLIAGENGPYGLMVDTVNGQKYDYNEDGVYWAFYINGEYAMTGVDMTPIQDGETYSFVATKA
jgi:predicted small lipoprotein YifL